MLSVAAISEIWPTDWKYLKEFPSDRPGQYINKLYLGPVTASLLADYELTSPERIVVSFVNITVAAGPFKWTKVSK